MYGDLEFPTLPEPADITSDESAWEALASVHARVNQANREILGREQIREDLANDLPEKLKKWLEKIYENLKKIVAMITEAVSFSLTVGTTISVAVNFKVG